MRTSRFSTDPKVKLVSISDFLEKNDYLVDYEMHLWNGEKPEINEYYYKVTDKHLIYIRYGRTIINFGMDAKEQLEEIQVAYRDGKSEYHAFEQKIKMLQEKYQMNPEEKSIAIFLKKIENLYDKINDIFPQFNGEDSQKNERRLKDFIVYTGCKCNDYKYDKKYLVFDVETNGVRPVNDDLLSLSIFDPRTGLCYNRMFPLSLQPLVLTTFVHGITDETLNGLSHMTQTEMDELIDFFDMNNSILLSYSGGKGAFDSSFVINYCKRNNVVGFENLKFENIKSFLPSPGYGTEGKMTKDNLCRLLKIDGILEKHSSLNDCILEWKLFEKIKESQLFFIQEHLFNYHKEYIIPITYLMRNPELVDYANVTLPKVEGNVEKIYEYYFPQKAMREIKKFSTNITGVTLEHAINTLLKAKEQNNHLFLEKNKS